MIHADTATRARMHKTTRDHQQSLGARVTLISEQAAVQFLVTGEGAGRLGQYPLCTAGNLCRLVVIVSTGCWQHRFVLVSIVGYLPAVQDG